MTLIVEVDREGNGFSRLTESIRFIGRTKGPRDYGVPGKTGDITVWDGEKESLYVVPEGGRLELSTS